MLLTSHPLEGRDGADKQLAVAIATGSAETEFAWFGRTRSSRPALSSGRRIPVVSRHGSPGVLERTQIALALPMLTRSVDLVHAVFTIGPGFRLLSRTGSVALGGRPVIHTVPGVANPRHLTGATALGLTVALSETTAVQLRSAGFPDVRVVPPAVPLADWPQQPRPAGAVPVVVYAGHFDLGGGMHEAILAAGLAARTGARLRLVLAMRARPRENHRRLAGDALELARTQGLDEVSVFGRVDDMGSLLTSASVLLFPAASLAGGKADVPITVLEAMATGRPVIVSDLPQFAGLGDAVLRVPVGDVDAAAQRLLAVLEDAVTWQTTAERGRAAVERSFDPARMAHSYEQLYREVLAGRA